MMETISAVIVVMFVFISTIVIAVRLKEIANAIRDIMVVDEDEEGDEQ